MFLLFFAVVVYWHLNNSVVTSLLLILTMLCIKLQHTYNCSLFGFNVFANFFPRWACWKTVRPSRFTKKYARTVTPCLSSRNGPAPSQNPASVCSTRASGPATTCTGSRYSSARTTTRCTMRDWVGREKWTKWLKYTQTELMFSIYFARSQRCTARPRTTDGNPPANFPLECVHPRRY